MKNWQLFKRNKKTGIAEIAFPNWEPMTEREADNCANAYKGTYQPIYSFFAAKIGATL